MPNKMTVLYLDWDKQEDSAERTLILDICAAYKIERVREALDKGMYMEMAEYEGEETDPDAVYNLMQNGIVTDSWTLEPPPGLTVKAEPIEYKGRKLGHRSMSIGDLVRIGDKTLMCAQFGFDEVPAPA